LDCGFVWYRYFFTVLLVLTADDFTTTIIFADPLTTQSVIAILFSADRQEQRREEAFLVVEKKTKTRLRFSFPPSNQSPVLRAAAVRSFALALAVGIVSWSLHCIALLQRYSTQPTGNHITSSIIMMLKRYYLWMTIAGSVLVLIVNVIVLSRRADFPQPNLNNGIQISSEFFSSRKVVEEIQEHHHTLHNQNLRAQQRLPTTTTSTMTTTNNHHNQRRVAPRILIGIISSDTYNDSAYRKRHRQMFSIWNDTRVCSLPELQRRSVEEGKACQIVYTFVIGANRDLDGPTEIVSNTTKNNQNMYIPLLVPKPIKAAHADVNNDDVSLLNIRYVFR
jgi:hypothetical protein